MGQGERGQQTNVPVTSAVTVADHADACSGRRQVNYRLHVEGLDAFAPQALLSTTVEATPQQIVEWFVWCRPPNPTC